MLLTYYSYISLFLLLQHKWKMPYHAKLFETTERKRIWRVLCSISAPSNFKCELRIDFQGYVKCFHRMCQRTAGNMNGSNTRLCNILFTCASISWRIKFGSSYKYLNSIYFFFDKYAAVYLLCLNMLQPSCNPFSWKMPQDFIFPSLVVFDSLNFLGNQYPWHNLL